MLEALYSIFTTLTWQQQNSQCRPLPQHVTRTLVPSRGGDLELLTSTPSIPDSQTPAIFFAHGGYGSAGVWLDWMTYLHNAGYQGPLYAYSVRNHGASYPVPYLSMVYRTSLDDVAGDLKTAFDFAKKQEVAEGRSEDMVLVGHSSGGGLAQYALSKSMISCRALCLVGAIPHFGATGVYVNWARHDPWFMARMLLHLQHPTSPLSSPGLVHGAFFGHEYPISAVEGFTRWMPKYESMGWPSGMMGSLGAWWKGKAEWLDVKAIVSNISGAQNDMTHANDIVCVLKGSEDMMMDDSMVARQAAEYRDALDLSQYSEESATPRTSTKTIKGATVESDRRVRVVVVEDAGHHVQNDVQQEMGAEALLQFVRQC